MASTRTTQKSGDYGVIQRGCSLIIPVEKTLVIKEKATTNGPDRLIIKSEKEKIIVSKLVKL